jgi:outer membrane immunogenic protein
MRVLVSIICVLAGTASPAFPADTTLPGPGPEPPPIYVPAPPPPPFTWAGFYFGPNGGFGFVSGNATVTLTSFFGSATSSSSGTMNGPIGGGQIGYNWQINSLVFGVEADGQWSNQTSNTSNLSCLGFCTLNETTTINWFATARGRVGYAFGRVLIYGTGGVAFLNFSDTLNATGFGTTINLATLSSTATGYAVGFGVETAFTPNLAARAEYLFMSSSGFNATSPSPIFGGTITETATIRDSIVRAGLNYRFPVGGW